MEKMTIWSNIAFKCLEDKNFKLLILTKNKN